MHQNGHAVVGNTPPDFSAEFKIAMRHDADRFKWFREMANIFAADGARWHRFSNDPREPDHLFYEGWIKKPLGVDGATDDAEFVGAARPGLLDGPNLLMV